MQQLFDKTINIIKIAGKTMTGDCFVFFLKNYTEGCRLFCTVKEHQKFQTIARISLISDCFFIHFRSAILIAQSEIRVNIK